MTAQTDFAVDSRTLIESQLRECYGRVVYSHKAQEKCADILLTRLSRIKVAQIVLAALTTAGFFAAVLNDHPAVEIVGVAVSTVLLALNTYTKNYDLGELAEKHRRAASDLWLLREKYLALLTDLRVGMVSIEKLMARRDAILEELYSVYSGAPSTTYRAYQKAREALQQSEDMTFSDAEIDAFLPSELTRTQSDQR